jgi:hypothetical protein
MEAKLKHLEFIQAVIARMATNSFLFKGWSITIAAGLAAFAAANTERALLTIALISTLVFWALDGYYLWLERCFIRLHGRVSILSEEEIDFDMRPDKAGGFGAWLSTLRRPHLIMFYGAIIAIEVVGIFVIKHPAGKVH